MDINVTVKLTCDEYMTKLMFSKNSMAANIKEGQTPLASVPEPESAQVQMPAPAVPTPAQAVVPVPAQIPVAVPMSTTTQTQAAPVAPTPAVPVAPPKQYTKDELMMVASQLMDSNPNNQAALVALLPKYGVQSFMELSPEQYGAFATDLRALGGRL